MARRYNKRKNNIQYILLAVGLLALTITSFVLLSSFAPEKKSFPADTQINSESDFIISSEVSLSSEISFFSDSSVLSGSGLSSFYISSENSLIVTPEASSIALSSSKKASSKSSSRSSISRSKSSSASSQKSSMPSKISSVQSSSSKISSSRSNSSSSSSISSSSSSSSSSSIPTEDLYDLRIMGENIVSAEKMATYLLTNNSMPKLECTVWEFVNDFLDEGKIEGVRGDIAFCQSIHETGWFKYGGDVLPHQNNYCGLGATGGGNKGASFSTPKIGIRAQIQHLKAYGSTKALNLEQEDPRYHLVSPKGKAPKWTDLSGKWAVPGFGNPYNTLSEAIAARADYGSKILKLYNEMKNTAPNSSLIQKSKAKISY